MLDNQFKYKQRNIGVQESLTFGELPVILQEIYDGLEKKLEGKKVIMAGIGHNEFSLQNEADRELYYLLY